MPRINNGTVHGVTLTPATKGLISKAAGIARVQDRYNAVRRALERQLPREQAKHTAREMFYFQLASGNCDPFRDTTQLAYQQS